MKFPLATPLVLYLSLLLDELLFVQAIRFPLKGRIGGFSRQDVLPHASNPTRLGRRASVSGTPDLSNVGNVQYQTNITLNEQQFKVLIDTGSSDLTVTGTVQGAKDTGKTAEVIYDSGATKGPVKTATLEFEGYSVKDQAFIEQPVDSAHDEGGGIIGLGPGGASEVQSVLGQGVGDSVLDRIFRQNTTTPNFITILLGRAGDPSDTFVGDFTVGEVVQPFGNITQQPKLPVTQTAYRSGQHWSALLDPNGDYRAIAASIYGRVPGAKLTTVTGIPGNMWTLPCTTELNVTFVFSGMQYPIHPLDTVTNAFYGPPDDQGNPTCIGAFQPRTGEQDGIDIILGMSFLRNAYMLINFGDFVDGALAKVGDPYVQLLPLTDPAEAHADFVQVRMGGVDRSSQLHLLPAIPDNSNSDDDSSSSSDDNGIKKYLPYIIAGSVAGGLILIALVLYALFGGSRKKYRRLHDPAPAGLPGNLPNPYDRPPPFQQYQPSRRY
ncbi:hypothetical protein BN946_scf184775.g10 [Trametes cinnabarina]|uniref:Peptidase A1 domain-containing protein n=1 Tax=Pycnoporus cinnabarinus TaxID=5643 RepID=A0A060SSK1_PYCCI|nr:hypothetical protein BN946_scf184775.g10 [Trametes cinnabarina]